MGLERLLSLTDISASGMSAERLRLEVIANNLANASSTRTPEGGPYRRQNVVFSSAYDNALGIGSRNPHHFRGVRVIGVEEDQSELPVIHRPGHPDADEDGFVTMPNVKPANEMVDLITASRAYEANLNVLRHFREMAEQALSLLRGT